MAKLPADVREAWEDRDGPVILATVNESGWGFDIFRYEASRYGASASEAGDISTVACSQASVLPWTMIGQGEAEDACDLLNDPSINCAANPDQCWQVCSADAT